jgi:hypothetical protein
MGHAPDRNSTHLAGEYFVAAELYRLEYSVGMTIGNAKAIDIFAKKDGSVRSIQVKAIRKKSYVGWPIMEDEVKDDVIYVFVLLNEPGDKVDYFIATSAEVRANHKQYKTRGIVNLYSLNSDKYKERWDKI